MKNQIQDEFKKLKKDITPRQQWVSSSRDLLLRQIKSEQAPQVQRVGLGDYVSMATNMFRRQMFEPALVMMVMLVTFLGSSLTINAAFYSLPGDTLYPVKITLEKTHLALVTNDADRVELQIEFAQKRVAEFDKIVSKPEAPDVKKKKIEAVVKEFKSNVVSVSDQLKQIKGTAPEDEHADKVRIAVTVTSKAEEIAKTLDEKVETLDEVERQEVEDLVAEAVASVQELAAEASQAGEEADVVDTEDGIVEGVNNEDSDDTDDPAAENSDTQEPADAGVEVEDEEALE